MHVVWINPQIIFCRFFRKLNIAIFWALSITMWMDRGHLVGATLPTVLYLFFRNFTGVLVMVRRYSCRLDIIIRLFFVTFLQVELSHFSGIIYNIVNGQGIPCGRNTSYSFIPIILKLYWCFGYHAYQTLECSTSGWILKTTALWRKSKIGKCHATAYGFLRLWYKYELRKYSH